MRQAEAPCTRSSLFLLGQNRQGNWVVQDQRGLCGGIFVNRIEALRFAMFENGNRPQGVLMVPGVFELDMNRGGAPSLSGSSTSDGIASNGPLRDRHYREPPRALAKRAGCTLQLKEAQRLLAVAHQHVLGLLVMVEHHLVRLAPDA